MSFKSKPTINNPNPIEFKKEIKILEEETSIGQHNRYHIPFKREPIDNNNNNTFNYSDLLNSNERINQLDSENISLKSKINDLNEIIQVQSNEIISLKLKLNKYEPQSCESDSNQNDDQTIINLETETNNNKHESEIDSDQIDDDDDETSNKVINMILIFSILKLLLFF
jgi:hypothetical protein